MRFSPTQALALAALVLGGGQATRAAQPTPAPAPATKAQPPAAPATGGDLPVVDGGRVTGQTTAENAKRDGLTPVDLSDEWLPYVFSETPEKPQPLRPYLIDLANGRIGKGGSYAKAREDRFFEAFGITPSLNYLRRRLADKKRHACHERVKDGVLEELAAKNVIPAEELEKIPNPDPATAKETPMITTGKTISPRPLTAQEHRAVVAMQSHLRCEDLLPGKANIGRMDMRTADALKIYQHLQMIADSGAIDATTRAALLGDTREQDFRGLLRALRERVVDATGLLEDGSALGVQGQVQGRVIDNDEFLPVPVQNDKSNPPTPVQANDPSAKVVPAPDLIAAATQAASEALGWTSPDAVLASTLVAPPSAKKGKGKSAPKKGVPLPLPTAVAMKLPPLPSYHGPKMELRAEIDRGEVVLARPKLDKDGHKKWKPPVADRPTLTLYAKAGDHEVALGRWPTTIGGWKTFEKSDGTMALKYKESVTGDALWPEILATPTWHPASGMPTRRLLVKRGDTWEPKTQIIGPGYRAAYGLVAIVHHQIEGYDAQGNPQLVDHRIRTHGTPGYRAVKRGESNGCHRMHNYVVLRMAGFIVKHHENIRDGLVPEDYVRNLTYKGQKVALESETKGYRFKLTPPLKVTVLDGDVKGDARAVKRMVPLSIAP